MVSSLSFVVFLLVLSAGCGLITGEREADKVPERTTTSQLVVKPPVESKPAVHTASIAGENREQVAKPTKLEAQSLTQDEIRRIQARLKASGFDPGPIDGILGPKTKSAFLSLQSSCSELLGGTDLPKIKAWGLTPANEITVLVEQPGHETVNQAEIQRVQMRLKQSGFDPGPVDGILGRKTHAALLRARAGCSLAQQFPVPIIDGDAPIGGSEAAPTFVRHRQAPAASSSPRLADSPGYRDNKIDLLADGAAGVTEMRALQVRLKNAGFDPGPIDGILGPRTKSALQRYRAANGFRDVAVRGSTGNGERMEY